MSSTSTDDTLATEAGIQTYLRNTPFTSHTVDQLSGGHINFTYRIHLHVPVDGMSTFILKYTPPYVASSADVDPMPFPPDRQVFIHILRFVLSMAFTQELCRDSKRKHYDWPTLFLSRVTTTP
ncbi:hypothetical protein SCLCIDRAFT_303145 [Scleroderma citrinum Foug A]|uniref:Aminoglycoside phosphotransferase domain-containing protein n=1 Tax=Scleroderma citrinum Foug A TaxID=1036808 RepID=A0A0C2Z0H8_9AGAM|nr:hypothetical protein SCLCIDRAFT_303145 [Scleroderma citrinum Foug A]